ncbi:MAG TPA: hypothetical protein IAB62_12795 [Candidatus Coprocola pullicola]|nr:hypothetical protein [Candidatus Coprocola pullicola]
MKFYKKAIGYILAITMAVSMTACNSATTEGETAALTPEEIIQAAETKIQEATSVESEMDMEIVMSMTGQNFSMKTNSIMSVFVEPLKAKMNTTVDVSELGSNNVEMYIGQEDGKTMMYTNMMGNWIKQEITQEQMTPYDTQQSMVKYLDSSTGLKEVGKEEVNAEEATKYEGVIARDTLAETMQSVGTTKNLEALLAGIDMTSDQLYEGLSDVKVAVWINAEGYPVKYEMDMTEMTQGLMRKVMQTSGVSAQEAAKLDVSTAKLSIINKNINNVTDFEIPEKAILATEVSL